MRGSYALCVYVASLVMWRIQTTAAASSSVKGILGTAWCSAGARVLNRELPCIVSHKRALATYRISSVAVKLAGRSTTGCSKQKFSRRLAVPLRLQQCSTLDRRGGSTAYPLFPFFLAAFRSPATASQILDGFADGIVFAGTSCAVAADTHRTCCMLPPYVSLSQGSTAVVQQWLLL